MTDANRKTYIGAKQKHVMHFCSAVNFSLNASPKSIKSQMPITGWTVVQALC